MSASPKLFSTTVLGVGPYCVEFTDGEIVYTRSEERQRLICAAPELLDALKDAASSTTDDTARAWYERVIFKAEGRS